MGSSKQFTIGWFNHMPEYDGIRIIDQLIRN
jgi:hypothetical protein